MIILLSTSIIQRTFADTPRVYCLRSERLTAAKVRLAAKDAILKVASDKLRKNADKALKLGPFSVMDKALTPPSGDKHDYMSFGPYWWPDPTRANGLPYIRKDGQTNPASKTDSDSPRVLRMTKTVETLALAYYFFGVEVYARHAAHLLRAWFLNPATKMNPNLRYGQAIPGRVEGRGTGIIDTRDFTRVVDAVGLLASYDGWTTADQQGIVEWFDAYLDWLLTSEHGEDESRAKNNHGTFYDVQVLCFALFAGKIDLAKRVLESSVERRIASQIERDGSQPQELSRTISLHYSVFNLTALFYLATMGEHLGADLWHYESEKGSSIRKALDYVTPYVDPTNKWPHKQIKSFDRMKFLPLLRQAAIVYQDEQYESLIQKLSERKVVADRVQILFFR